MTGRQVLAVVLVYACGNAVAEHLIYIPVLAPRLAAGTPPAWWWWVGMYTPLLAAVVVVGGQVATPAQAAWCGVLATAVVQLHKGLLGWLLVEGHTHGLAVRNPLFFWTAGTARVGLGLVAAQVGCAWAWQRWRLWSRRIG